MRRQDRLGVGVAILVGTYVIVALAYSTIYQATVQAAAVEARRRVRSNWPGSRCSTGQGGGAASSPVGEGLADALNVGGI